ncbi:MAG: MarR family transcriptional regulator [Sphingomonas fennica]
MAADEDISELPEAVAIRDLGDIVGFHIRLAHGAVYRHFTETFSDLGLTQKQTAVLWLLDARPGVTQSQLARELQMDRATMMAIVNRLEARGYLRRAGLGQDRRQRTIELLPAGRSALAEARAAIQAHEHWIKSRFTPREVRTLVTLLERIHG